MLLRLQAPSPVAALCAALLVCVGASWPGGPHSARAERGRRQEAAVVRRLRCLVVDSGHDVVARRRMARVRVDLAGARRPAGGPESPHGSGIAAPARHEPGVHARRQGRDVHDRADEGGRREGAAVGPRPRRRERGRQGRRGSRGPRRRQHAAAHVGRHHDPRDRSGHDRRARRRRQPAGGIVGVGRDAPRPRGWRRARRTRWRAAGAAAGRGASRRRAAAASGGRRRRRAKAQRATARRAPSARTTAAISIVRNLVTGQEIDDSARQRLRVVEGRILARLRGLVGEGRRGRRVRPQDERRHDRHAAQGQGQLQEPRLRRGGRAARVPQRPGRVRQGGLAVSPLLLEGRRRRRRPSSCRRRRAACRRAWS